MKRLGHILSAAGLVGLALSVAAWAQESSENPGPPTTSSDIEDAASPRADDKFVPEPRDGRTERVIVPGRTRVRVEATPGNVQPRQGAFLRASSFVGMPIMGTGNAQLGTVSDILIDPNT